MKSFAGKTAVITGAGSGIGQALARALHAQGAHLALCDLRQTGLEATRAQLTNPALRVSLHGVDVSDAEAMQRTAGDILAAHGAVDMLVNNAGITAMPCTFEEVSEADFRRVIDVNMWGVYYGMRVFLPHLKTRPEASIVTISSLAGKVGLYGYSPYAMSKFAVRGLSEVLQMELAGSPVGVLVVFPGGVKTNLIQYAAKDAGRSDEQQGHAHQMFMRVATLTPDRVAARVLKAVQRGRRSLLLGPDAKLVMLVVRLFPQRFASILGAMFGRMVFH